MPLASGQAKRIPVTKNPIRSKDTCLYLELCLQVLSFAHGRELAFLAMSRRLIIRLCYALCFEGKTEKLLASRMCRSKGRWKNRRSWEEPEHGIEEQPPRPEATVDQWLESRKLA